MDLIDIQIPVWLYRALAIFPVTGMIGVDHFALGSKYTGMAKAFVNLISFGSWYVYDALQSFDGNAIGQAGLSIPFVEIGGIGAGKIFAGTELTPGAKNFLNIFFTAFAGLITIIAFSFAGSSGTLGKVATAVTAIAGTGTAGIAGSTVMELMKQAPLPAGLSNIAAKMVGGGATPEQKTQDFFAVGLLFVLAAGGFSLAAVRS